MLKSHSNVAPDFISIALENMKLAYGHPFAKGSVVVSVELINKFPSDADVTIGAINDMASSRHIAKLLSFSYIFLLYQALRLFNIFSKLIKNRSISGLLDMHTFVCVLDF